MKIRLTFKDQRPIHEIEADGWDFVDGLVRFDRKVAISSSPGNQVALKSKPIAVYVMNCLLGFEVVSA